MKIFLTAVIAALLSISLSVTAAETSKKLCPDPLFGGANLEEWLGDEVLLQLDLDTNQQQQIAAIKTAYERARDQNLQRLGELTLQLDALDPNSVDFDTVISAIAKERAELVGEQVRQRIRMVAAIQEALSPAQQTLLERKMTERMQQQEFIVQFPSGQS